MSNELSLIIAIFGLFVSFITIMSFWLGRKDKSKMDGAHEGEMRNDIKYIKQTQTEIMVSQKEILNKLDDTNERVTRLEEQVKMQDKRLTKLEN